MDQTLSNVLRLIITIVDRGKGQKVADYLKRGGSHFQIIMLGRGTAKAELLAYLGLGESEKDIVLSATTAGRSEAVLQKLSYVLRLDVPGGGIAFTIPITSVGGVRTLNYLKGEEGESRIAMHEVIDMEKTQYALIITVVGRGFTDQVMEAAHKAGAKGGTVLHARGAGQEEAAKFFGLTIQPEKEIVLILVPRDQKLQVMQEITKGAGLKTECRGFSFSVPVDQAMGILQAAEEEDEKDE